MNIELKNFTNYVKSFYNLKDGVYKLFTDEQIEKGCKHYYIKSTKGETQLKWGKGDSLDRENVRHYLETGVLDGMGKSWIQSAIGKQDVVTSSGVWRCKSYVVSVR